MTDAEPEPLDTAPRRLAAHLRREQSAAAFGGEPPDGSDIAARALRDLQRYVASFGPAPVDFLRPSPARRYDFLLGGRDNFAVDRTSAAQLQEALPSIRLAAAELRRCMRRIVDYLLGCGIRQFLDIGCGLPSSPNVHEIVHAADPTCKVVYVDSDRLAATHARALLVGAPDGPVQFVDGDLIQADAILHDRTVREVLDFDQPIAVLLLAVLHFIVDDQLAHAAVKKIKAALAPGSCLAITHVTVDPLPADQAAELTALARSQDHGPFRARTSTEIAAFLDGLQIDDPGLVPTVQWHPRCPPLPRATVEQAVAYAAIGWLL